LGIDKHSPDQQITDWQVSLRYLREGNERYRDGRTTIIQSTSAADRDVMKSGQIPFATIITCSDSRVAPEVYFDQRLGDIFVIRNAGNVVGEVALGTVEFAAEVVKTPLFVVVGHSDCRAVMGAYGGVKYEGYLEKVMERIRPALTGCRCVDEAIHANIGYVVNQIKSNEFVMRARGMVVGAYYDIETGAVAFGAAE